MKLFNALALLIGLFAVLALPSANASTTIQFYFGEFDIAEGSIGILVADTDGNGFSTPGAQFSEGTTLRAGSRLGVSDDVIVAVINASSAGFVGSGVGFATTIDAINYGALGIEAGTPLAIYWLPGTTNVDALPGGALWEGYRADAAGAGGNIGFITPADEGVFTISAVDAANGGDFDPSNPGPGYDTGTVGSLPMIETPDTPADNPGQSDSGLTQAQLGTYFGLLTDTTDPSLILGSAANFRVGKAGAFSVSIFLDGSRHVIRGRFDDTTGLFTGTSRNKIPASVSLQLVQTDGGWGISGTIATQGGTEADINLDQLPKYHPKTNPHGDAGKYTILIPAVESADTPNAPGWATLSSAPKGRVKLKGKLADGEKLAVSTFVGEDRQIGIFAPLYKKYSRGSIGGWLTYRDVPGKSDIDGEVRWIRNAHTKKRDLSGFDEIATPIGSKFTSPLVGENPLNGIVSDSIAVHISGGNQPLAEGARLASLAKSSRIDFTSDQGEKISATISTSSGTFKGKYQHKPSKVTLRFEGVVFQKQDLGLGCLSFPSAPGTVLLAPTE